MSYYRENREHREMQKSLFEITQKNSNIFNHVFDEMKKMKAEIKVLKTKVEFQDSVIRSMIRPNISGIYDTPTSYPSDVEDIYDTQNKKLTVEDLICDEEPEEPEVPVTMDEYFRKSQIKGIRPVPLIRQTNRISENTDATDVGCVPLVRQSCYYPVATGLPPLVSRESSYSPPLPSFVTEPKSEYISPFNYTSYQSGLNYV